MIHSTDSFTATLRERSGPFQMETEAIDLVEIELIERCKAGESAAWNTLIKRYETSVLRFAYSLSHNHEDADDIAGSVFLRLYCNISNFRYECGFRTWLFRIIRNTYVDMCIRAAHRKSVSLDSMRGIDGESDCTRYIIDPQRGPEVTCIDNETASLLNNAIRHLPAYQREVVHMYHIEGKSYDAIAEAAGLSVGTVKSRLNRARNNLRERLSAVRESFMEQ